MANIVYGHTLVNDSSNERIILVGGTRHGQATESTVYQMDVKSPMEHAHWEILKTIGDARKPRISYGELRSGAEHAQRGRRCR